MASARSMRSGGCSRQAAVGDIAMILALSAFVNFQRLHRVVSLASGFRDTLYNYKQVWE
jgi:hypothetical protein